MGASGQQQPNNSGDTSNEDYTILYRRHLLVELRPPLHMNYLRLISSEIDRLHRSRPARSGTARPHEPPACVVVPWAYHGGTHERARTFLPGGARGVSVQPRSERFPAIDLIVTPKFRTAGASGANHRSTQKELVVGVLKIRTVLVIL
jgi:hypothetical protein